MTDTTAIPDYRVPAPSACPDRQVPDAADEPTLTVERTAAFLGISRGQGYEGVRTGEIPSIRVGRRVVVPTAALRRMLELDGPVSAA